MFLFLQFNLTSLRGKEYFAKELEPGVFGPMEPEPLEKKYHEPGPAGKKRSRSRLKIKSGTEPLKKIASSPALEKAKGPSSAARSEKAREPRTAARGT